MLYAALSPQRNNIVTAEATDFTVDYGAECETYAASIFKDAIVRVQELSV